jgi:CRP-like cAMP-binding protein
MSIELRKHIEKVTPLTDEEFEYIRSHFTTKKLKKHQFLVQQGDPVSQEYFIISGLLKAYYPNVHDGKEHIIQFGWENMWITDYEAFFNNCKAHLNIDCVENVELLCLSIYSKEKICAELHKMEHFFRRSANQEYVILQSRVLSLLMNTPKERYGKMLTCYPSLFQRVPKTLIASYLGVSRETLSRLNK